MIITRKIQVYVNEPDPEQKKEFVHTLYNWRDCIRRAANIVVAHKFVQQNVRDFVYIKDDIKDKFYVKDIINEGKGMSEANTTYRIVSEMLKGKVPSDMYSSLNNSVAGAFKDDLKKVLRGEASIRNYKNNIPMPFSKRPLETTLRVNEDGRYIFTLFGIPMALAFGRDRSNNQVIVDRCIAGEYKMCASSIQIIDQKKEDGKKEKKKEKDKKENKNKMFLLLCVDVPQQEYTPIKGKTLYAFLGVLNPITYVLDIKAKNESDSGKKVFTIGTAEEFFHGRRQIQEALKRIQIANRYTKGGRGRKKKCKSLEHFRERELNYVDTKLHTYSRLLVNAAVSARCERIILMKQQEREEEAQEDKLVLRNWSYSGLKQKIEYKCDQYGITLQEE